MLSFWGGEPTLNPQLVIDIIKAFEHRDNVKFHIYTNAFNRKRLEQIVDAVDPEKLDVQISFDGTDISNKFRITHSGKGSATQVLENTEYFAKKGVKLSLKSTLPLLAMDSLYKTWQDFKKLHAHLNGVNKTYVTYSPTIDYVSDLPDQIIPETVAIFREQMLKIAKKKLNFIKNMDISYVRGLEQEILKLIALPEPICMPLTLMEKAMLATDRSILLTKKKCEVVALLIKIGFKKLQK